MNRISPSRGLRCPTLDTALPNWYRPPIFMKQTVCLLVASFVAMSWLAAQGPKREPEEGMYDSCPDLKPPKTLLELARIR